MDEEVDVSLGNCAAISIDFRNQRQLCNNPCQAATAESGRVACSEKIIVI